MERIPKLKEMTPKERISYIWDYYKWVIILAVIAGVVIISIVRSAMAKKEEVAYVLMVNADTMSVAWDPAELFTDFLSENGYDPKHQEVTVNTGIHYLDGSSMSDVYGMQALTTVLGSGTADVCLMGEELFTQEASLGAFIPVQYYLSEEELEALSDRIVWVESDPDITSIAEDGEDPAPGNLYARGIRLTENDVIGESGLYPGESPVIGIAASSERPELAAALVHYLMRDER